MSLEYNVWPTAPSLVPSLAPSVQHQSSSGGYAIGHAQLRTASPPSSTSPGTTSVFTLRDSRALGPVQAVAFGEGKLASASDNTVLVWGLQDWRIARTLSGRRGSRYEILSWDPRNLSSRLLSVSPSDRSLKLWDLRAKTEHQVEFQLNATSGDIISHAAWNPDGNTIALGSSSALSIYDTRQNRILTTRKFESTFIGQFCFQNPHRLLVGTEQGTLDFVDATTLATHRSFWAHPAGVNTVVLSGKNPSRMATGGHDALIELWNVDDAEETLRASVDRHISRIESISFSANGKWIASSSYREKTIDVSSADTGELLTSIVFDQNISALSFDLNESSEVAYLAFCTETSRDVFVQPITGLEGGQEQRPTSRQAY